MDVLQSSLLLLLKPEAHAKVENNIVYKLLLQ